MVLWSWRHRCGMLCCDLCPAWSHCAWIHCDNKCTLSHLEVYVHLRCLKDEDKYQLLNLGSLSHFQPLNRVIPKASIRGVFFFFFFFLFQLEVVSYFFRAPFTPSFPSKTPWKSADRVRVFWTLKYTTSSEWPYSDIEIIIDRWGQTYEIWQWFSCRLFQCS